MANRKFTTRKTVAATQRGRSSRSVTRTVAKSNGGLFDYFRLSDSYASLLLGLVVVIVAAVLLVSLVKSRSLFNFTRPHQDISATNTVQIDQATQTAAPIAGGVYVVKDGEDLWRIAEAAYHDGYKWVEIAKANNITNPSMISAGQKLTLPKISTQAIAQNTAPTTVTTAAEPTNNTVPAGQKITGATYTVAHGDDLWDISVRAYGNGYKWVEIAKANNLTNPNVIHSGNVLKLPR